MSRFSEILSIKCKHFFHEVSEVRPVIWISVYIAYMPIFALIYYLIPNGEFRIPEGGLTDYGAWLYYSIVTITTLGFGDYTPMGATAQTMTALEVMLGMLTIGFFLNAVGSMKSEIDIKSEKEKLRLIHNSEQKEKLIKSTPVIIYRLNLFLSYCYAVTTLHSKRTEHGRYNPAFTLEDMADMKKPVDIPQDQSGRPAVDGLLKCSANTCLLLDQLQARIDLTQWPDLLDDCFSFVANYQMLSPHAPDAAPYGELAHYIREDAAIARKIEVALTQIASKEDPQIS